MASFSTITSSVVASVVGFTVFFELVFSVEAINLLVELDAFLVAVGALDLAKIVVEGLNLYLVTCKDIEETIRLYNKIRTYCYDNKIGDIIFFGSIPKENRKTWYKKIHERTGVDYNRLYRSNSR
jgi:hypothetical protein